MIHTHTHTQYSAISLSVSGSEEELPVLRLAPTRSALFSVDYFYMLRPPRAEP